MKNKNQSRGENEIQHGKFLAQHDAETTWGWGSAAGKVRAERRAKLIINHANLDYQLNVLEIGCGTGLFTSYFSKTNSMITALDISEDLIAKAKMRNYPKKNVTFICHQFENYIPKEKFDAIIGSSILHHLDMYLALNHMYKILNPGGRIVFTEPNYLNPQIFLERTILRNVLTYVSPDEMAFVKWKLKRDLIKGGFTNVYIKSFDWLYPLTPPRFINTVNRLGIIFEKTPILKEFSGSLLISAQRSI